MNYNAAPIPAFSEADIRHRVSQHLQYSPEDHDGDYVRNPGYRDWVLSRATRDAAVLIPFVERSEGMHMVLTKRAE